MLVATRICYSPPKINPRCAVLLLLFVFFAVFRVTGVFQNIPDLANGVCGCCVRVFYTGRATSCLSKHTPGE